MVEEMIAKMAVLVVLESVTGMGGLAPAGSFLSKIGLQFGGKVPGPEGAPRMAIVHGGEQWTNPSGMGGASPRTAGAGAGGGSTINITVGGAFASMRELQRTMRRNIRSTGDLAMA